MDYVEAAIQLGTAIKESGEFLNFRDAEAKVLADEKAQELMLEFRNLQTEMADAAGEEGLSKEDLEKIRDTLMEKQNELNEYGPIKEYFDAVKKYENMMRTVNGILKLHIEGENDIDGCTGNCGTCHGCG